jgi:hypothetical protein
MSFTSGFGKYAAAKPAKGWMDTAKAVAGKAQEMGKGFVEGAGKSLDRPLKEHLNPMTAVKHVSDAAKGSGGYLKSLQTGKGRKAMGEALGKAAPGAVVAGGYLAAGKKVYDKTLGAPESASTGGNYLSNSYYGG